MFQTTNQIRIWSKIRIRLYLDMRYTPNGLFTSESLGQDSCSTEGSARVPVHEGLLEVIPLDCATSDSAPSLMWCIHPKKQQHRSSLAMIAMTICCANTHQSHTAIVDHVPVCPVLAPKSTQKHVISSHVY